jgi:hypothetical protein
MPIKASDQRSAGAGGAFRRSGFTMGETSTMATRLGPPAEERENFPSRGDDLGSASPIDGVSVTESSAPHPWGIDRRIVISYCAFGTPSSAAGHSPNWLQHRLGRLFTPIKAVGWRGVGAMSIAGVGNR